MHLDIAQRHLGIAPEGSNAPRVAAKVQQRLTERGASPVDDIEAGWQERTSKRARPREGHWEAYAFLVAESHDVNGEGQFLSGGMKPGDRLDSDDDAEIALIAPGVCDCIS